MANYFFLELDTTPPNIEIYIPSYTNQNNYEEIRIVSNEILSYKQNFYIIDGYGQRYDLNLEYKDTEFIGKYRFNLIPLGIVSIYAQVEDETGNKSDLIYKTINIIDSPRLILQDNLRTTDISIDSKIMESLIICKTMDTDVNTKIREIYINNSIRRTDSSLEAI